MAGNPHEIQKSLKSGAYRNMHDALTSKDASRMRPEFQNMRGVCMACHNAENVGFLNDSAVLMRTEAFPPPGR